jgi:hypothetical protein
MEADHGEILSDHRQRRKGGVSSSIPASTLAGTERDIIKPIIGLAEGRKIGGRSVRPGCAVSRPGMPPGSGVDVACEPRILYTELNPALENQPANARGVLSAYRDKSHEAMALP